MRRREFVGLLGGAAAAWPLTARAQQPERLRRIGVLLGYAETDQAAQSWLATMERRLSELGWNTGRNIRVDVRWAAGEARLHQIHAKELVGVPCDVIVAGSTPDVAALLQETRTIPIVFAASADPIGSGFVASFARPGGNVTGISNHQGSLATKWLELLKEVSPALRRVAVMFNPNMAARRGTVYLDPIESAAASLSVVPVPTPVGNVEDIERALADVAREPNGGLVVPPDPFVISQHEVIVAAAARHRLPAVYPWDSFVRSGGLIFYGASVLEAYLLIASYVDRILRGAKPGDLPVQAPTRFRLVINLKAAKAIGLMVSESLLLRADEVIE